MSERLQAHDMRGSSYEARCPVTFRITDNPFDTAFPDDYHWLTARTVTYDSLKNSRSPPALGSVAVRDALIVPGDRKRKSNEQTIAIEHSKNYGVPCRSRPRRDCRCARSRQREAGDDPCHRHGSTEGFRKNIWCHHKHRIIFHACGPTNFDRCLQCWWP